MKNNRIDWKFIIKFLAALAVFVFALVKLGIFFFEYYQGEQEYQKLKKSVLSVLIEGEINVDFEALQVKNTDTIGWIYFENLDISYPIVQGEDNEYYLSHTFQKEENKCGSIFMEAQNAADFSDNNTFIYGHNMKDKTMFAKLNQFQQEETYQNNPDFLIYTPDKILRYQIFSCYPAELNWDSFTYQFENQEKYASWQKTVIERSLYEITWKPSANQKTVTLMTCTPMGENYRFLVHAGLVEEKVLLK